MTSTNLTVPAWLARLLKTPFDIIHFYDGRTSKIRALAISGWKSTQELQGFATGQFSSHVANMGHLDRRSNIALFPRPGFRNFYFFLFSVINHTQLPTTLRLPAENTPDLPSLRQPL